MSQFLLTIKLILLFQLIKYLDSIKIFLENKFKIFVVNLKR